MIEKNDRVIKLPCGHQIQIAERGEIGCHTSYYKITVSIDRVPDNLGIKVHPDGCSAVLFVKDENLPVLRDLLLELAPLPSPATIFRENVIKIFNFLKGGKS